MSKSIQAQIEAVTANIAKLQEKLVSLQEKAANFVDVTLIVPGVTVAFPFGRAEKRRTVSGEVRKVSEGIATIVVDQGDDLFVTKLSVDAITAIVTPGAEEAVAEVSVEAAE